MSSLKGFIKAVRQTKTLADERAVIQKESAAIRTSFREEPTGYVRQQNVLKLLYLFTLGERTHFGQIECVKLLASPRFSDKRLGYLGTMLLLDENQEVLTLVTNSMQNDFHHPSQYVAGLALCTLGNIASPGISRDLFPEVEKLLASSNAYLRRKAVLCAMRILKKVPELQELFVERAKSMLTDRNNGVLLGALMLVADMCENDSAIVEVFRPVVPALVRQLKQLISGGFNPEYDVLGIQDPFLQIKVLRLFRILGRGNQHVSEQINDILAQVATNTDSSKNVGNAILYETVLTILDIEAESGLKVLAINILGNFLANKDNNMRYVALNTLIKVIATEPNAVQRHRATVIECLRDPDISIRRRALDLSFALVNENNIRVLVREFLIFLETADTEFKIHMTRQIDIVAEQYAPNKRWHIDTVLRILEVAGNHVPEDVLSSFIRLIATNHGLQTYAIQKLYLALSRDISQESLTIAGLWSIGEYCDFLFQAGALDKDEVVQSISPKDVVDLIEKIRNNPETTPTVLEYIITAFAKISARISDKAQIERVHTILKNHAADSNVEVQQRANEYDQLFKYEHIRLPIFEPIPPPPVKNQSIASVRRSSQAKDKVPESVSHQKTDQDLLLDLMADASLSSAPAAAGRQTGTIDPLFLLRSTDASGSMISSKQQPEQKKLASDIDLLADIFG